MSRGVSISVIPFVVLLTSRRAARQWTKEGNELYDYYNLHRLERGLNGAEQRAADQRIGELAADFAKIRGAFGHSLSRGRGVLKGLGRAKHMSKEASAVAVRARY